MLLRMLVSIKEKPVNIADAVRDRLRPRFREIQLAKATPVSQGATRTSASFTANDTRRGPERVALPIFGGQRRETSRINIGSRLFTDSASGSVASQLYTMLGRYQA